MPRMTLKRYPFSETKCDDCPSKRLVTKPSRKGPPLSERKSDNNPAKRQQTKASSDPRIDNIDDPFLRRMRGRSKFSGGLVRLGSEPANCDLRLFTLGTYSMYVRRRLETIGESDDDSEGSPLVMDLPDCPGDRAIFRIVQDFCLGLMDEEDISVSNVVKLLATSNFLEMESLTLRASKFLEGSIFKSWESCLRVLATFDDTDSINDGEGTLFDKCEKAFVQQIGVHIDPSQSVEKRMSCSMQCLLRVAELLPRNIANRVYESCRTQKFGLFHKISSSQIPVPLSTLFRADHTFNGAITVGFEYLPEAKQSIGVRWIEELTHAVPNWLRRSILVLHLAKSIRLKNDLSLSNAKIRRSIFRWDFLSTLLVEAVELRAMSERSERVKRFLNFALSKDSECMRGEKFAFANFVFANDVDEEIENLERLVGCGLGEGDHWCSGSSQSPQQDFVVWVVRKFKFDTLLSIVRHFRESGPNYLHILSIAKVLDASLEQHLKEKTFTVQQVLLIYREFPNESRSSHAEIYNVFEDILRTKALTPGEVHDLTKVLDYGKLSDEVVEKLMAKLLFDCDPRLEQRFLEKERQHRIDQEKMVKLQNKETTDLLKVHEELRIRSADLTKATQDIQLAESKLKDVRHDLEEEQEKTKDLLKVTKEKLLAEKELKDLKCDLQEEQEKTKDLSRVTAEKLVVESKLKDAIHALEEEQDKTTCQICFARPRDALSLPCMHFLYCFDCMHLHHQNSKTCPTCRGPTTGLLKCLLSI